VVNRRKSTGGKHHYRRQEEESPAFQSLQDIISEMKRLPSISVTSPNNDFRRTSTNASRGRRFSEPFHTTGDSKYHDSLQPIDEYLDEKDEKACFVSQDQLTPAHQKRTRSQSGKKNIYYVCGYDLKLFYNSARYINCPARA
jgi:hypothetical protein